MRTQLLKLFGSFQDHNKSTEADPGADGLHRGTHAKGQCFNGKFTVLSDDELRSRLPNLDPSAQDKMIRRLKQVFLASQDSATYPVVMRFANADGTGKVQADALGDVRGFSFSIQNVPTTDFTGVHRQDFMMNSTAAFASGEIHEFTEIVKAASLLN